MKATEVESWSTIPVCTAVEAATPRDQVGRHSVRSIRSTREEIYAISNLRLTKIQQQPQCQTASRTSYNGVLWSGGRMVEKHHIWAHFKPKVGKLV